MQIPENIKHGYVLKKEQTSYAAVLTIHGYLADARETHLVAEYLHKHHGLDVYGVCLKGMGETPEALRYCQYSDWIDSARKMYLELLSQYEQVFIYGISMGALVSLALAKEQKPAGLILLGTALSFADLRLAWGGYFGHSASFFIEYVLKKPYLDVVVEPERKVYIYNKVPARSSVELWRLARYVKTIAPRITAPVLLLHSKDDKVIKPDASLWLYQNIGSQDKVLRWAHGTHSFLADPHHEHQPVLKEIGAFCENTV